MIKSETQNKRNTLASLAILYPEAFAMTAACNSRSGLGLRCWALAGLNPARTGAGQSPEDIRQQFTNLLTA